MNGVWFKLELNEILVGVIMLGDIEWVVIFCGNDSGVVWGVSGEVSI